jgi:hypothetical protein
VVISWAQDLSQRCHFECLPACCVFHQCESWCICNDRTLPKASRWGLSTWGSSNPLCLCCATGLYEDRVRPASLPFLPSQSFVVACANSELKLSFQL